VKVAIITGGNAGLGLSCAEEILRDKDWRVIIACRDPERAQVAVTRLQLTGGDRVEARPLDLASLASVRHFASTFAGPIDALVLNAGVQIVNRRTMTEDGFETTFAVNHLAHFLLANLLLGKIAEDGRIVFVSSNTHDPTKWTGMPAPRFTDPFTLARGDESPGERPGTAGRRRYSTSKLCNVYCAYELDRRLAALAPGQRITVNAFDPGFMPATGLARDYGPVARFVTTSVLPLLTLWWPNANRVQTSARRLARLAIDPRYQGVSGRYFSRGRPARSSNDSYDEEKARALWEASLALSG
jgi:NAD(P)-dependent dehydrogenase (short-subunit alcohol dehydrogenase family)